MEQWKYIEGFKVSNLGNCIYDGKITKDSKGYLKISKEDKFIHILVAKAFCNWFEGCHTHHINGNKLDNRATNLICLTPSEHTKIHKPRGKGKKVEQYTLDGEFVAEFKSITEVKEKTGISITSSLKGKTYTSGGYLWVYKGDDIPIDKFKIGRSILQYTKDFILLNEFRSISDASRKLGICKQAISQCIKGKQKTANGFIFKKKED